MAEAFLRHRLADLGVEAHVHSAGLLHDGQRAAAEGIQAMGALGLDTTAHRSRRMTADMVEQADLVVGMAREHVREAVLLSPGAWPKAFTLKELVRRGEQAGPRADGQLFDEWLAKLHAGRQRQDVLGSSPEDDVADPIGLGREDYRRTAADIEGLVSRLVDLVWGGD
jgi:protein-tyrosine phosphatase